MDEKKIQTTNTGTGLAETRIKANLSALVKTGKMQAVEARKLYDFALTNPAWMQMIQDGKFEPLKAVTTLRNLPQVFDEILPGELAEKVTAATIRKYHGTKAAISVIVHALGFFYEITGNTPPQMIISIAQVLYGEFWHLSLSEWKEALTKGAQGVYEKKYPKNYKSELERLTRIMTSYMDEKAVAKVEKEKGGNRGLESWLNAEQKTKYAKLVGKLAGDYQRKNAAAILSEYTSSKPAGWKDLDEIATKKGMTKDGLISYLIEKWEKEYIALPEKKKPKFINYCMFRRNQYLAEYNGGKTI